MENEVPTYNGEFKIIRTKKSEILSTIETLERSLKKIKIRKEECGGKYCFIFKNFPTRTTCVNFTRRGSQTWNSPDRY